MIIGNWKWAIYEEALAHGFSSLGVKVYKYSYNEYECDEKAFNLRHPFRHWRNVKKVNANIVCACIEKRPSMIFFYRGAFILPSAIRQIKSELPKTVISFYHNDNPFVSIKHRLKYLFFLRSLQYSDITYVYRPSNLEDCRKFKAVNPKLLMSHYCTDYHWWDEKYDLEQKIYDVVFIGHHEEDGREEYINSIFAAGINLHVFGPGLEDIFERHSWPRANCHDKLMGDAYRATINQAKIALVFLSGRNRDVYTRRCFEIPASGTAMLLPDTWFLREIFPKDVAAVYYSSPQSMVVNLHQLLEAPEKLEAMTRKAYSIAQHHNEKARAKQIIKDYKQLIH